MANRLPTTPRSKVRAAYSEISEKAFTAQVIALARWNRWRVAHFRPALSQRGRWLTAVQGDGAGFPDLVMVRGPVVIFAELKSKNGKLSKEQVEWVLKLTAAGEVYVWRPSDIDEIERVLR